MESKLNAEQKARGFEAFWAALGRPGGEMERLAASAAYMQMELTPRLAGALVSDALAGFIENPACMQARDWEISGEGPQEDWVPF